MASADNQGSSTLKSHIDNATGAVQSAMGNVAGKPEHEVKGEAKRLDAEREAEASHAMGKVGPYAMTAEGGVARDNPDRQQGQWDQTMGSTKQAIGGLIGNESMKKAGDEQRRAGEQLEAQAQLGDLTQGVADRVEGTVRSTIASLTGNRDARDKADALHDDGKAAQRSAEHDIQKTTGR